MKPLQDILKEALNIPDIPNTITLYHGGSIDLPYTYKEMFGNKKGKAENGVGLYLTTHYETAYKYAKGMRRMYLVTVEKGTEIHKVNIDLKDVLQFVKSSVPARLRSELIEAIGRNMKRMGNADSINASYFLNLCVNFDACVGAKSALLRAFLVGHGVDYEIVQTYGGRQETVLVVINPAKIVKVQHIKAADVTDEFELPFNFE